ncbi:FAD-dependent oxidoreductase [Streptomyces sp. TP-A0874]|uniref:FAD-dependent oxidoreductase n=1 Tax=Streptomyces sp. TP-A0874 TaxID=549819 RepID=UPI000852A5F2|nr:FAD-dependent oxidoreductase [Streptomyces sp. TP-A0874]
MDSDAIVIGAGVIGLTTAVVLAESGSRVRVRTAEEPRQTTSAVAGALWWPYRIEPEDRTAGWSLRTLEVLTGLADHPEETGVRMVTGTMAGSETAGLGEWAAAVPGLRSAVPEELPAGQDQGLRATLPLVDMPTHLDYLRRRLTAAGGVVEERGPLRPGSWQDLAESSGAVLNCSGLGSRQLVPDPAVRPVRGQLVVVENPGVREWLVAADPRSSETLYLFPQPYGLVLGGTAGEDDWELAPDPATAEAILDRCARVRPDLRGAKVLAHRVGLRPSRVGGVRLEQERLPGGGLGVHNYGHGGAGVTVAWGCAEEAAGLAAAG